MSYIDRGDLIFRVADGANIPKDARNRDYAEYQRWLDLGNAPQAPPLPEQKAAKVQAARKAYGQRIAAGISYTQGAVTKTFQIDGEAQVNLGNVMTAALDGAWTAETDPDWSGWRALDNTFMAMTTAEFKAFARAARARVMALRKVLWTKVDAARAAADQAALDAIDVNAGWPA